MKNHLACLLLALLFVAVSLPLAADGPLLQATGKLFGVVLPGDLSDKPLVEAYESSGTSAVFVRAQWGSIQRANPGGGQSSYDFSGFDSQPLMTSDKTRVCLIDMTNPWAVDVKDPQRRRELAQSFLAEVSKHAGSLGIRHFWLGAEAYARSERFLTDYAADVVALNGAVKSVAPDASVIAGPHASDDAELQRFYVEMGASALDVLAVDIGAEDPRLGIDIMRLFRVREIMMRNGDSAKKILVVGSPGDQAQIRFANVYRSVLTQRDMCDPNWILGAVMTGKVDAAFLKSFPPEVPSHTFDCSIESDSPVLNYVTGKSHKLSLTFKNLGGSEVTLDQFSVDFPEAKGFSVDVKPSDLPKTAGANATATAVYAITFPKEAAGRALVARCTLEYTLNNAKHFTDCYVPAMITNELELTLLPQKLILGVETEPKSVGMSIINHTDAAYSGEVALKPYNGIKTSVARRKIEMDPFGLDAFVFKVEKEPKTKPGHYAILVEVGDKIKDWIAVDVALQVSKASGKTAIDGDLADWKGVEPFGITVRSKDGTAREVGIGHLAFDEAYLYAAFQIDDSKHVSSADEKALVDSVQIAVDPLINGAGGPDGGFRDDDYMYVLKGSDTGAMVHRLVGPPGKGHGPLPAVAFKFRNQGGKSYYEVALPWSELTPLDAKWARFFGLSVLVNMTDGSSVEHAEWGGGIVSKVDPRAFMPAILTQ